jgi:hypothetical protein
MKVAIIFLLLSAFPTWSMDESTESEKSSGDSFTIYYENCSPEELKWAYENLYDNPQFIQYKHQIEPFYVVAELENYLTEYQEDTDKYKACMILLSVFKQK